MPNNIITIPHGKMKDVLYKLLKKHQFSEENSQLMANVFTENSLVGVNSHGINRVPLFIKYVEENIIKIDKQAIKTSEFGSIERWDGQLGPGIVNADICTKRAVELAKLHGMGLVALRNTNHWMRGGYYGWQAANQGCIAILFTNTIPNMPAWGAKDSRLGNNPFITAIPRAEGHVVLDMAVSQYSFGKINEYKLKGEKLPFDGGYDDQGQLSNDPEKILKSHRALAVGYWKGSALSMILDMLATLLSAGNSTYKIGLNDFETGISQIFLCIYPEIFNDQNLQEQLLNEIINYTHMSQPINKENKIYFPGERSQITKFKNLKNGIPVSVEIWNQIINL